MKLKKALKEYAETKATIEALTAELKRYQTIIEAAMNEADTDTVTAGSHTAKRNTFEQMRFNSTAFKADFAALYDEYRRPVTVTRFTVS